MVSYVLHLLLRNKRKQQRPAADRPNALAMLKDTARWGAFLGSFSGALPASLPHCCCTGWAARGPLPSCVNGRP